MQPKILEYPSFLFVGLASRTSNVDEMAGKGKIGEIWQRFYAEEFLRKIPNQANPGVVLALYTDYESDASSPYSFAVGVEVRNVDPLPSGLTAYSVPAAKYAVFTSERGSIPAIVIDVWKAIWSSSIKRRYHTDFEVYDGRARDRNDAQIDVYVSTK